MSELLNKNEKDKIIAHIRKQKFKTDRRNVAPWCMQWVALLFSIAGFIRYLVDKEYVWNHKVIFAIAWLVIAMFNNILWKQYMEQSVLKELLDKSDKQTNALPQK